MRAYKFKMTHFYSTIKILGAYAFTCCDAVARGGSGGGGGAGSFNTPSVQAGSGGKGVVILSVATIYYTGKTTGSPTVTTSGANKILQFNGSGSYTT